MNNLLQLAVELGDRLGAMQIPWCVIGGVAVQRWGEPRQTVDVDGIIFAGYGNEVELVRRLVQLYPSRIEDSQAFAIQNRIVLLANEDGLGIDISLGGMPYEERVIERSSDWEIPQHGTIRTCGAEDLVVLKSFASRPQDWIDIEKVIIRQGSKLDRELILTELQPLVELKEEPEILDQLQRLFDRSPNPRENR